MDVYPPELVASATSGNMVPFIGAGLSVASGAPSWSGLLEQLLQQMEPSGLTEQVRLAWERGELGDLELPDLHTLVTGSRFGLLRFLNDVFGRPYRTNEYHDRLRQL